MCQVRRFTPFPCSAWASVEHGVSAGLAEVCVVQEPIDGGGRQRLGHELVEPAGVQVRGDRHGFAFVGGFDDALEPFGGISADG